MKKDELKKVSKVHTIYKTEDGQRVCGVTTILSVLAKPALIAWANRLGLEGIDSSKYTDKAARIGTLAHYLIQCHIEKTTPDLNEYSPFEISKAENALLSFLEWEKGKDIEPIANEMQLVSEKHKFGGTIDYYCKINGLYTLVDFKTGSGIYDEHYYQTCAYRQAMIEKGYKVDQIRILNIPRIETEAFTEKIFNEFSIGWQIFECCLQIYNLKKEGK
jgi:hypothetical protein